MSALMFPPESGIAPTVFWELSLSTLREVRDELLEREMTAKSPSALLERAVEIVEYIYELRR